MMYDVENLFVTIGRGDDDDVIIIGYFCLVESVCSKGFDQ